MTTLAVRALRRWRQFVLITAPLALLPLILYNPTSESKCAYVVLLVASYWVSTAVPLAAASLLPIVLFPLLGILPTDQVTVNFMKESNVMLLAGIMTAIAIENCNLHRRIALKILLQAGTSPKWLTLSFMFTTAFLSMWINNTSAASLMVPIVESILEELFELENEEDEKQITDNCTSNNNPTIVNIPDMSIKQQSQEKSDDHIIDLIKQKAAVAKKINRYRKCTLLSVAYGASLGGAATITGSGTNLIMRENLNTIYDGAETGLTYASWLLFGVPCSLLCLIITWLWLQIAFLGPRSLCESITKEKSTRVKNVIRKQYKDLGSINFHQIITLVLFTLLVFLWMFRQPAFIPGWASFFPHGYIKDSVAGIGIVFLMFALPSRLDFFCCKFSEEFPPPAALTWPVVQKKVPWGIILLMGSGYALAEGSKVSGLSAWLGTQFAVLAPLSPALVVTVLVIISAMLTEITSNAATATMLMPVLAEMAVQIQVNPIYLMLPSTIACSYAFMLPIATPPNAIVSEASGMSIADMAKPGILSNILCSGVLILMINTLGVVIFNLNEYPSWAPQGNVLNVTELNTTTTMF